MRNGVSICEIRYLANTFGELPPCANTSYLCAGKVQMYWMYWTKQHNCSIDDLIILFYYQCLYFSYSLLHLPHLRERKDTFPARGLLDAIKYMKQMCALPFPLNKLSRMLRKDTMLKSLAVVTIRNNEDNICGIWSAKRKLIKQLRGTDYLSRNSIVNFTFSSWKICQVAFIFTTS